MLCPCPCPCLARQFEDVSFEDLQGADARKAMLIITVMAAHAFGEGSGVGVSYSGQRGWAQVSCRAMCKGCGAPEVLLGWVWGLMVHCCV